MSFHESLFSRRNRVDRIFLNGRSCVRKIFADPESWRTEQNMYRQIGARLPEPKVLGALPGVLILEDLPLPTLLDELDRQEREGFRPEPWRALAHWLESFHRLTRLSPADVHLRNFLWDAPRGEIYGLDFEDCGGISPEEARLQAAAFLLEYRPSDTPVKRRAAQILTPQNTDSARAALRLRRQNRTMDAPLSDFSFLLLAGGRSSRMGRDKASLPFAGGSLLEFQLDKIRMLGIGDVMISGDRTPPPGVRAVPDRYPCRGPLGGLHAGLSAAARPHCLVMSVDVPLVPACILRCLAEIHSRGGASITLARHGEKWEPLIGVYDCALSRAIEPLIRQGGAPVRRLMDESSCHFADFDLPEEYWINVNTPEAYRSLAVFSPQ